MPCVCVVLVVCFFFSELRSFWITQLLCSCEIQNDTHLSFASEYISFKLGKSLTFQFFFITAPQVGFSVFGNSVYKGIRPQYLIITASQVRFSVYVNSAHKGILPPYPRPPLTMSDHCPLTPTRVVTHFDQWSLTKWPVVTHKMTSGHSPRQPEWTLVTHSYQKPVSQVCPRTSPKHTTPTLLENACVLYMPCRSTQHCSVTRKKRHLNEEATKKIDLIWWNEEVARKCDVNEKKLRWWECGEEKLR